MPYPHTIRLRGPWQFEPLRRYLAASGGGVVESPENLPGGGRAAVPGDWGAALGGDFRGRVRYRRAFHATATLDPHERLWLVVEGVDAQGVASVNGAWLGEIEGYALESRFDVTTLIASNNEVILEVELPADSPPAEVASRPGREHLPGGPVREVRLEVRTQWFLKDLAVWSDGEEGAFVAAGSVGGDTSPAPLAVVISGCQRELAYFEVSPGETFEMKFKADGFPVWSPGGPNRTPLEVKLLGRSTALWQKQIETAVRATAASADARVVREILTDGEYQQFDRAGLAIIQQVPPAWANRVCRRLAHHPSITGWISTPGPASPAGPLCGRAWVA